jgi:putative ABC transport system permease protein
VYWEAVAGAVEQGLIYSIMALGVYITLRVLNFADLTIDGSFPLGGAVAATLIVGGIHPLPATIIAACAGALAGLVTGVLHTKMKITGLLSGILTMTALYSVNYRIMGKPNVPLLRKFTVFQMLAELGLDSAYELLLVFVVLCFVLKLLLDFFLSTEIGLALRATGDNQCMIRSLGTNTDTMIILGLILSNSLVALSGALFTQRQGVADINSGVGTIVIGLASVIIGTALIKATSVFKATLGVLVGSVIYRLAIFYAMRAGLPHTDLKMVSAILVIIALSFPAIKQALQPVINHIKQFWASVFQWVPPKKIDQKGAVLDEHTTNVSR